MTLPVSSHGPAVWHGSDDPADAPEQVIQVGYPDDTLTPTEPDNSVSA